mmetsp:Transcript_23311/g.41712  ORF Transcript_23311/g.41712 Transcript_23311/m.41712 type:complete len:108 (+) Transcript_23311:423-746(+)
MNPKPEPFRSTMTPAVPHSDRLPPPPPPDLPPPPLPPLPPPDLPRLRLRESSRLRRGGERSRLRGGVLEGERESDLLRDGMAGAGPKQNLAVSCRTAPAKRPFAPHW